MGTELRVVHVERHVVENEVVTLCTHDNNLRGGRIEENCGSLYSVAGHVEILTLAAAHGVVLLFFAILGYLQLAVVVELVLCVGPVVVCDFDGVRECRFLIPVHTVEDLELAEQTLLRVGEVVEHVPTGVLAVLAFRLEHPCGLVVVALGGIDALRRVAVELFREPLVLVADEVVCRHYGDGAGLGREVSDHIEVTLPLVVVIDVQCMEVAFVCSAL